MLNLSARLVQQQRNNENSLMKNKQTKSFDLLEFDKPLIQCDYEDENKSKSFDDDFCYNTKISQIDNILNRNIFDRAASHDRVLLQAPNGSKSLKNSPRTYGSRLYDYEGSYEVGRRAATRSPIMSFKAQNLQTLQNAQNAQLSRERSPNRGYRKDYSKKPSNSFLQQTSKKSSDSDESEDCRQYKEKNLVAEYLYGLKNKQLQQQQQQMRQGNLSSNRLNAINLASVTPSSSGRY